MPYYLGYRLGRVKEPSTSVEVGQLDRKECWFLKEEENMQKRA